MHRSKLIRIVSIICIGITAAGLSGGIKAQCIESVPDAAAFTAVIDGTTSCSAISGQFGCRIDDGEGSCYAEDPERSDRYFTVSSTVDADGARWVLDASSTIKVDTALVGGATQGNACAYSFQYDTAAGTGGFKKSKRSFANIHYVEICSDSVDQTGPPPPPEPIVTPVCGDFLDLTGIMCPTTETAGLSSSLVCNIELTDVDGDPVPFYGLNDSPSCCVCNRPKLDECDPSMPDDFTFIPSLSTGLGPCAVADPNIPNTEVTSIIELNNDPYYCRTIGGVRRCFSY